MTAYDPAKHVTRQCNPPQILQELLNSNLTILSEGKKAPIGSDRRRT